MLRGEPFRCSKAVDLDLVKVTAPPGDAVLINGGCTGQIRRLEVDTWTEDGVKIRTRHVCFGSSGGRMNVVSE